jgi:hypothetical protein
MFGSFLVTSFLEISWYLALTRLRKGHPMRKWQLITAATVGIMASGSGFIQAQAADFYFDVDFQTKEVANFDDFTPIFIPTTYGLTGKLFATARLTYSVDVCNPGETFPVGMQNRYSLNGTGTLFVSTFNSTLQCSTSSLFRTFTAEFELPSEHVEYIIEQDNYILFRPLFSFGATALSGRTISVIDFDFTFTVEYDFDTTYLFNYFLSDNDYQQLDGFDAGTSFSGTIFNKFDYVMTAAGNDRYFILNSNNYDYGTNRVKFAVDYNMEYFRGETIGAQYKTILDGTLTVVTSATQQQRISIRYRYYYLNAANNIQPIVGVPEFNFEYEDCGSFLALNVGCFVNNALAYITNDAPIISDAITLLNAGMQMAGQAFGVIGSFTDDNVFGVLVLGGLGIIAVRWFLKND